MACRNGMPVASSTDQRRSANYKPDIWKYDYLLSLTSQYTEERYEGQAKKLKDVVKCIFLETAESSAKLELIDSIGKLGLATIFDEEIKDALDTIVLSIQKNKLSLEEDLYTTSLCFRILRQHGYGVSQDIFNGFLDDLGKFKRSANMDVKAILELFEASNMSLEVENIMEEARIFSVGYLKNISSNFDDRLAKQVAQALDLPLLCRVEWYNVRRHINLYERENHSNPSLLELAKLNFNMIQATHQKDLRELSRWWRNLGISESLSFTRNRIVESYLWAVGVAFEPQCGSFRKWLTKVIKLILILDDVYDVYGSLQELEQFTNAVERWDNKEIYMLPECMKICFHTLCETTAEIAWAMEKEKGWSSVLPHLQEVWANFCKALLVEAKWYNQGYTPSLQEYLDNGWISSSGPVLSLHAFFSATLEPTEELIELHKSSQDLVYYTSLIIRLCNDQGTSAAELERGDASSSILCYMKEANVSEEVARDHIRSIIMHTWKNVSNMFLIHPALLQPFAKCTVNIARVAQFIYQNGDGFGVQDRETRDHVLSMLIEPLAVR